MLLAVTIMVAGVTAATSENFTFRPPAIPLITADPFMQTFIMGDNSTADAVKMWDSQSKSMLGLLRVDGIVHRFLGVCSRPATPDPKAVRHPNTNLNPGHCDIDNFHVADEAECNARCHGTFTCQGFVLDPVKNTCFLKNCAGPLKAERTGGSGSAQDQQLHRSPR